MLENSTTNKYDEEDAYYCASCLSLKIINLGDDELVPCYCGNCGSTDIGSINIHKWDEMYKKKYGKKYLSKK